MNPLSSVVLLQSLRYLFVFLNQSLIKTLSNMMLMALPLPPSGGLFGTA